MSFHDCELSNHHGLEVQRKQGHVAWRDAGRRCSASCEILRDFLVRPPVMLGEI